MKTETVLASILAALLVVLIGQEAFTHLAQPSIYTDRLSGCQYLVSPAGFMTVRRDRALKQVCISPG